MGLTRNSDQKSETLKEFYSELATSTEPTTAQIGNSMLHVVSLIDDLFRDCTIWGLTSLYRLVLQNADNWKSDWLVSISSGGTDRYLIEYLLPARQRPWQDARVMGYCKEAEVKEYILIAMARSEGWKHSAELERLLKEHNNEREKEL